MPAADLRHRVDEDKNFVYLKRQVSMEAADKIKQLGLPGVHQQPETRRYYPDGDVMAHVVGFNSVEDQGQEGVELTFNQQLSVGPAAAASSRTAWVASSKQAVTLPVDGRDLRLSIDTRLQYLVFRTEGRHGQAPGQGRDRRGPGRMHTGKSWRWPMCRPSIRTSARPSRAQSCAIRRLPTRSSPAPS